MQKILNLIQNIKNNTINFKDNRKNIQNDERISDKIFIKNKNIYIKNLFLNKKISNLFV